MFRSLKSLFFREKKTVLIAWELGGGMGHAYRLLPIARAMQTQGHAIVFALRTSAASAALVNKFPNAVFLQAPYFGQGSGTRPPSVGAFGGPAVHYADVLLRCGYDTAAHLESLVMSWRQIFDRVKPSIVVCDFSPTTVLAAAGRIPVVHIGSGFATPPVGKSFLHLSPSSRSSAKDREARVFDAIQQVSGALGVPSLNSVSDLLGFAENFSCTLPELDPYQTVRSEPAIGPMQPLPAPSPVPDKNFLFGYLDGDAPGLPRILNSLVKAKVPAGIFIRGSILEYEELVRDTTVTIYQEPQSLGEVLRSATGFLHHGGLGSTETALAIGRPQFFLPKHLEQVLTVDAVVKSGCGANLAGKNFDLGEAIQEAMEKETYQSSTLRMAEHLAKRRPFGVVQRVVNATVSHMGEHIDKQPQESSIHQAIDSSMAQVVLSREN